MSLVAVIGAGGFVGASLVEALTLDGVHEVRAVVRAHRNVASLARFGSLIDVVIADAEDQKQLRQTLDGASVVINLTTGPPKGIVRSTEAIYDASVGAKCDRLVHLSSAVVFGRVNETPADDDQIPNTRHWMPYARAKCAAENWLRERVSRGPIEVAVLRPGIVWGVRSPHTMHLVRLLRGKNAYLVGDGTGIFNGIYIDNLVACIQACCESPQSISGYFNVADEERVTWRDFLTAFAAHLDFDMTRIPMVSDRRCPLSRGLVFDWLLSLPLVNTAYHRAKGYVPDRVKAEIKSWSKPSHNYEHTESAYTARPHVERELWHLQRVANKLPHHKFVQHFDLSPPVTFAEGVQRTLHWLRFIGYASDSVCG